MDNKDKMKQFRKHYVLTQRQAAELTGYSYSSWQAYERGYRKVPAHLIVNIEGYARIKVLELNKNK